MRRCSSGQRAMIQRYICLVFCSAASWLCLLHNANDSPRPFESSMFPTSHHELSRSTSALRPAISTFVQSWRRRPEKSHLANFFPPFAGLGTTLPQLYTPPAHRLHLLPQLPCPLPPACLLPIHDILPYSARLPSPQDATLHRRLQMGTRITYQSCRISSAESPAPKVRR